LVAVYGYPLLFTSVDDSCVGRNLIAVCLFFQTISLKPITKPDIQMFHSKSWKPVYLRVKIIIKIIIIMMSNEYFYVASAK